MRKQLANLRKPKEGITIEDRGDGLILFRFFHERDLRLVMGGRPWLLDQNLLALNEL
ncbi:hypothetical protein LINGRAHAP2_LOCUS7469 [Linum grandiflorum]